MSDALSDAQVKQAADFLDEATANGLPLPAIPESCRPRSAADGGRIYWERWSRDPRPAVAWKAAAVDGETVLAPFFDGMVLDSPASIRGDSFLTCILEAEVAFRMGRDFAPTDGGYSEGDVLGGVSNAYIVIEAPNVRFEGRAEFPSMAADGVGNHALIIGPEIGGWQSRDLVSLDCEILINGERAAEGREGRPNPVEVLVATVNEINNRGMTVSAGQVVTTGAAAMHVPGPAAQQAGQQITIRFPGIGDVELDFT